MLHPEDENENEVRRIDQNNINRFARLNARLHDLHSERDELKKRMEQLDDASTELMMGSGETTVLLQLGESFLETAEEEATEHCERLSELIQIEIDKLGQEEETIVKEQAMLKQELYGRFGKSINLEE